MKNKKYYGNAVQAILDTAIEKYCVDGDENLQTIVRLLNTAVDMAFMYDLKEFGLVFSTCAKINSMLMDDKGNYGIYRKDYKFYIQKEH